MRYCSLLLSLLLVAIASPLAAWNLLNNSSFAGNLNGWTAGAATSYSPTTDATGVPGSGSADSVDTLPANTTIEDFWQCVPASQGTHTMSGKIYIPNSQVSGNGYIVLAFYDSAGCSNHAALASYSLSTSNTGSFISLSNSVAAPAGTAYAWIAGENSVHATAGTHEVFFDDVMLDNGIHRVEDFNDDGKSDIALQNQNTGGVAEWQMNGATVSGGAMVATTSWKVIASGDFNYDGYADFILQNGTTGQVAEWQMNGFYVVQGQVVASPAPSWKVVATDSKQNVFLQNSSSGDVALWILGGFNLLSGNIVGSPGTAWKVIAIADFNSDYTADVLLQNTTTGDVAVWLLGGGFILSAGVVGSPGTAWKAVAAGDIDGDGYADIILQNQTTGDVVVWLMNGLTVTSGGVVGSPGTAWAVVGTGDHPGSGHADILLRDTSGNIAEWQMSGLTINYGAIVSSPGTAWVPIVK